MAKNKMAPMTISEIKKAIEKELQIAQEGVERAKNAVAQMEMEKLVMNEQYQGRLMQVNIIGDILDMVESNEEEFND